jgi:hypothetical protein
MLVVSFSIISGCLCMLHLQRTDLGLIVWALSTSVRCSNSLQECWNVWNVNQKIA